MRHAFYYDLKRSTWQGFLLGIFEIFYSMVLFPSLQTQGQRAIQRILSSPELVMD
jgi:hypothetical protein